VGASDPHLNTASATCSPDGFGNVLNASDGHSVNLFQPSITLDKTADNIYSKVGDTLNYTITLTNTSSADTPDLECTVTDATVGVDEDVTLASGGSQVINVSHTIVAEDDGGPGSSFTNTASATCSPRGFANVLTASDGHSAELLHPSFTVALVCANAPVPQEGPAQFTATITNTGDVELVITANNKVDTFNLAPGASDESTVEVAGPFSGQATVPGSVTASWVLPESYGLSNTAEATAEASCDVGSRVTLLKYTQGVVAPSYDWMFGVYDGPNFGVGSAFLANPLATDSTLNDADGVLDFDSLNLDPTKTYTICELNNNASAGWTQEWKVDTDGDGVADTVIPAYNPEEFDVPMANTGFSCADFGAGTSWPLVAGGTLVFEVNNQFPGGEPRTPGYWKNWSSCTGGGQYAKATGANDPNNEFWALDELLNDPGFRIGDLYLDTAHFPTQDALCKAAVSILDHRDIVSGKKVASDAAYDLARNLLAYRLNQAAGACQSTAADQAALLGQALLDAKNFTGTGKYLTSSKTADYKNALMYSKTLDAYNNGLQC
jgi:uncharacterized repeat protein (TIGR01451 family)